MNRQIIFDVVLFGIRAQGGPSSTQEGSCKYRGPNGRRCAVGMWISDAQYNSSMEGNKVEAVIRQYDVPTWFWQHASFLNDLQMAHDYASTEPRQVSRPLTFFESFESRMKDVARIYNLIYTPPGILMPEAEDLYTKLSKANGQQPTVPASPRLDDACSYAVPTEIQSGACLSIYSYGPFRIDSSGGGKGVCEGSGGGKTCLHEPVPA